MLFLTGMPSMNLSRQVLQKNHLRYLIFFHRVFSSSSSLREIHMVMFRYHLSSQRSYSQKWLRQSLLREKKQEHTKESSVRSITSSVMKEDVHSLLTLMLITAIHLVTMHSCLSSMATQDIYQRFLTFPSRQMSGLQVVCQSLR